MRKLIFLIALMLTVGMSVKATNVTFRASAPEAVVMGQQFQLTFTVNAEATDLRVQEMPDFNVLMGPSSSKAYSSSWVNGRSTSETTITYTYILMPKSEGTFNIAPATIKANNANYTSNGLTIRVLPPDRASDAASANNSSQANSISADDYFVRMEVSKRSVYEQEGFLVTFKLYAAQRCGLNNIKFPEFEGFLAQEVELPQDKQWTMDNYNGRNFYVVTLKQTVLYPQRSGDIRIEGGRFVAQIPVRVQRQASSIFDEFFNSGYQTINKELTVSPVTIDVKPLPSGKPASFSGSVGNYTMTSEISSNNIKANEAVTVKLKIAGNGNIRLLRNPDVKFPNDFEIYDPKVTTDINTAASGTNGSRTIEYMAIPRYAGDFEIPAIQFSYFDLRTNSYRTLATEPYKLHVERGEGGDVNNPIVSNFTNREALRTIGEDIRFIKVNGISFIPVEDILFGTFLYWMCYLLPAILFIVFFIIYRKQVKENSDIAFVRTKKANKMAVRRLKNAGKFLKENKNEEFYEEVLRALWGYLSDKLSIPQANLTKDNVEAELLKYGVSETLITEFIEILNTCEFARYAPSQATDAKDKLYELTVDAIGKMESTIKK